MNPAQTSSSDLGGQPDSSFGYGLVYNPMDPYNMYPHHETGEEIYGPPPLFGINKHDPLNMKPFNPNVFAGLVGAPGAVAPVPTALNTMGPNPFTPLLQPATPAMPMAPVPVPAAPGAGQVAPMAQPLAPMGGFNPLLTAAALNVLTGDDSSFAPGSGPSSSFNTGADPSSSASAGEDPSSSASAGADPSSSASAGADPSSSASAGDDPSSSYLMSLGYPYSPYYYSVDPFGLNGGYVLPQNPHPTDPNNQYPHPLTGSMSEPGPALAGGYNVYDPQNVIGAPPVFSERERILEHNRAAMQAQSPYAPYRLHQVPVPK